MKSGSYDGFFVGWGKKFPKGLHGFLICVCVFLIGIFAGTAYSFVVTQPDPGEGAFRFDLGRQNLEGVLQAKPYPMLHVAPGEKYPDGHTIMLAGQGKRGVVEKAASLDGQVVKLRGILLKRGSMDMLQVAGKISAVESASVVPTAVESLGRYRMNGEICDGKCYAGAMRPGTGIAHKACANLCLSGGVPPVFVSVGDVEGTSFFMLADPAGNALDDRLFNLTAIFLEAEGELEKHGKLMVFKIDLDKVKVH